MPATDLLRRAAEVLRAILGVPGYERYAAHMRRHHPDVMPLTRDDFVRERLNDRYSRAGSRCC